MRVTKETICTPNDVWCGSTRREISPFAEQVDSILHKYYDERAEEDLFKRGRGTSLVQVGGARYPKASDTVIYLDNGDSIEYDADGEYDDKYDELVDDVTDIRYFLVHDGESRPIRALTITELFPIVWNIFTLSVEDEELVDISNELLAV